MVTYLTMSPPFATDAIPVSALYARQDLTTLVQPGDYTSGIRCIAGVKMSPGNTDLKVAVSSGMDITVAAGTAVLQGTDSATQGVYLTALPSAATLTVTASDASLARIDRVVAWIDENGDATSTYRVEILAGTPSISPVAPSTPTNGTSLATIAVGAGVTSLVAGNITDTRVYYALYSGIRPVASSSSFPTNTAAGQAFYDMTSKSLYVSDGTSPMPVGPLVCTSSTRPTNKVAGQTLIYETDTKTIQVWDGSAWKIVVDTEEQTFVPVWSSTGTAPSLGNGTIIGKYSRQGKMIDVFIHMTLGSTSTAGTGTYYWSLPFGPVSATYGTAMGTVEISDNGGSVRLGTANFVTGPKVKALYNIITGGTEIVSNSLTATAPLTWNTGDYIALRLRYQYA